MRQKELAWSSYQQCYWFALLLIWERPGLRFSLDTSKARVMPFVKRGPQHIHIQPCSRVPPFPITPSLLPTGRADLMYWVVDWLPASPTCPVILRQSDLSPGWMLVLRGWMSDNELYRFPAQLLISQQWGYLSGYANLLRRQVSSSLLLLRAVRQGNMWEVGSCLFTSTSQSPAPSLNKLTIFL